MRNFFFAAIVIMFYSCQAAKSLKVLSVLKKGDVQPGYFLTEIPFELVNNLVVIKVVINGKTYSFLVDTGAPPTLLSTELANGLQLKTKVTALVGDANGTKTLQNWALLDTISIGGIQFYNAPCITSDISSQQLFACMKFDGILGASLMRQAVWSFDFSRKIVTVTNSASNLKRSEAASEISFDHSNTYTPLIEIEVNGKKTGEVINFDMGYTGTLLLGKYYFREQKSNQFQYATYSVGNSMTGLYGSGSVDTMFYSKGTVGFAGNTNPGQVITYRRTGATIIGMQLLRNYNFTLDWFNKKITFVKGKEVPAGNIQPFGFAYRFDNTGTLTVSELTAGSDAWQKKMNYGDTIVSINGKNLQNLSKDAQCDIMLNGAYDKEATVLDMEITQQGELRKIKIDRSAYDK